MGKYELLKWPLFRIFLKDMHIAVKPWQPHGGRTFPDEGSGRHRPKASVSALFPEGTIPATAPRMKHFKDGAFKLAIDKQVPMVPVTFVNNTWRLFGDPEKLLSRGARASCRGRGAPAHLHRGPGAEAGCG
jgi:1-acyl-sn-glycerol-3-phosphate acyltransferase